MGYGKKNTIKIDPLSYNIGLIGESGIGKTTIIKEMCEKLVGEDGYRFLECGKEDGADGINGINYLNCPEWSMDYDEETNSIGFEDFVDDVVENKSTEYPDLMILGYLNMKLMKNYIRHLKMKELYEVSWKTTKK